MDLRAIIEQLAELNKSNNMDTDFTRWAALLNILSMLEDDPSDKKAVARACTRAGMTSATSALQSINDIIDDRIKLLQQAKKDLSAFKSVARDADKPVLESCKRKNEGLHPYMLQELQVIFDDYFAERSYWRSDREFKLEMEGMANNANDTMVSDAIQYMCDRFGYDPDRLELVVRDDIADGLSQMAQVLLDNMNMDASESKKRKLESRIKRLEKLLSK